MNNEEEILEDDAETIAQDNTETEDVEIIEETQVQTGPTVEDLQDKLMRNMAEFDNFRKRTIKEMGGAYDRGAKDTIEKLLPVIDNFDRAIKSLNPEDEIAKGVLMIYKQLETTLGDMGVTTIDCQGKEFDANLHNAVQSVEDENYASGTVVTELQKGYMYKDTVVRHSMVAVSS